MATATAALARATPVASQRGTAAFHEITLEDTPPSSDDITSISRLLRGREAEGLADENNPVYAASRSISSAASSSSVKSKYFRLPGAAAPDASSVVLKRVANAPTRIESSELEKTARPTKRKSITIAQSESRRRRTAEDAGCTGAKKHSNAPGEKTMNKKGADDAVLTSKITKPSMGSRSTKPAKTRYLSPPRLVAPSEGDLVQPDQSLGIDRSIIRRRDWTPVKDSICIIASSNEPSLVAHDAHDPGASAPHVRATFTALGDTYGFTGPVAAQDSARTPPTATATTRRRRVEVSPTPMLQGTPTDPRHSLSRTRAPENQRLLRSQSPPGRNHEPSRRRRRSSTDQRRTWTSRSRTWVQVGWPNRNLAARPSRSLGAAKSKLGRPLASTCCTRTRPLRSGTNRTSSSEPAASLCARTLPRSSATCSKHCTNPQMRLLKRRHPAPAAVSVRRFSRGTRRNLGLRRHSGRLQPETTMAHCLKPTSSILPSRARDRRP